jgi:hypothetical protein
MDEPNNDQAVKPGAPERLSGHEPSQPITAISLAELHSDHETSGQFMLDSDVPARIKAAWRSEFFKPLQKYHIAGTTQPKILLRRHRQRR